MAVHFQVMVSGVPSVRWISCNLIHNEMNSSTCDAVVIWPLRAATQPLLRSSRWIDLFLHLTNSNKLGARCFGASPSSQLSCQKRAFCPSPIVTVVDALKSARSRSLQGSSIPAQGLEVSTQSCHSHLKRNALLNLLRSGIPSPPRSFGLVTVGQLTRQCPPLAFSSPFQRKDLLILSMLFRAQAANGNTVR